MNPLTAHEIRGNWATLLLAWTDDALDMARVNHEIDVLIGYGVDGIYMNGTAGEFHEQTESEFRTVARSLAERCEAASMPFQIGVSHMSARISLERLRYAVRLAPSAVQLVLPDWFPVTDDEAIRFLTGMSEEAHGIGLVLYAPPHAKRWLGIDELTRFADAVPALVGVKVAGGDDTWYAQMRERLSRLSVFVPGHLLASGVKRGAHGSYSNVACLHPGAAQRWWTQIDEDTDTALELEGRIRTFMTSCIEPFIRDERYANYACDRLLALVGGWADVGAHVRWPYRSIPEREVDRLRADVERMIPEFGRDAT